MKLELSDEVVGNMGIGALFKDYNGKVNSLDFHRTEDRLVTASDDESIRLYDTTNATLLKIIHSKKYGADQITFTHHPSAVLYSSKNGWDGKSPCGTSPCTTTGTSATSRATGTGWCPFACPPKRTPFCRVPWTTQSASGTSAPPNARA